MCPYIVFVPTKTRRESLASARLKGCCARLKGCSSHVRYLVSYHRWTAAMNLTYFLCEGYEFTRLLNLSLILRELGASIVVFAFVWFLVSAFHMFCTALSDVATIIYANALIDVYITFPKNHKYLSCFDLYTFNDFLHTQTPWFC